LLEFIDGDLPSKQKRLVLAWVELRHDELMADWNPFLQINGLHGCTGNALRFLYTLVDVGLCGIKTFHTGLPLYEQYELKSPSITYCGQFAGDRAALRPMHKGAVGFC
jgi:hypothetical protein